MRTTVGGRLGVYRTRDAGASWALLTGGLPQEHCYVTVLRESFASDSLGPLGLYLGTSGGHLFVSSNGGDHWRLVAGFLPRILSVRRRCWTRSSAGHPRGPPSSPPCFPGCGRPSIIPVTRRPASGELPCPDPLPPSW